MVPTLAEGSATQALHREPACPDAIQKRDTGTWCVHLPDLWAGKGHPQCYRKTSGTKQNEGCGGALGIKIFPTWVTHVRPEKCGHSSSMVLLGTVGHEVGLKRKYIVTDKSPGKESVTALQESEDKQGRFESHLHTLALDSEQVLNNSEPLLPSV